MIPKGKITIPVTRSERQKEAMKILATCFLRDLILNNVTKRMAFGTEIRILEKSSIETYH